MKVSINSKGLLTIRAETGIEVFALKSWIKNNSLPEGIDICFEDVPGNPIEPGVKAEAKREAGRATAKPKTLRGAISDFRRAVFEITGDRIHCIKVNRDLLLRLVGEVHPGLGVSVSLSGEIDYADVGGIRFEPVEQEPKTEADRLEKVGL